MKTNIVLLLEWSFHHEKELEAFLQLGEEYCSVIYRKVTIAGLPSHPTVEPSKPEPTTEKPTAQKNEESEYDENDFTKKDRSPTYYDGHTVRGEMYLYYCFAESLGPLTAGDIRQLWQHGKTGTRLQGKGSPETSEYRLKQALKENWVIRNPDGKGFILNPATEADKPWTKYQGRK